jgi:hypothetical protein
MKCEENKNWEIWISQKKTEIKNFRLQRKPNFEANEIL